MSSFSFICDTRYDLMGPSHLMYNNKTTLLYHHLKKISGCGLRNDIQNYIDTLELFFIKKYVFKEQLPFDNKIIT